MSEKTSQRVHRPTVRGLASRLKSASSIDQDTASNDSEDCHVYSKRVAEAFTSVPQMPLLDLFASSPSPVGLCRHYLWIFLCFVLCIFDLIV